MSVPASEVDGGRGPLIARVVCWRRPQLEGECTDPLSVAEGGAATECFRRCAFHVSVLADGAASLAHADPDITVSLVSASRLGGAQVSIDLRKIVGIVAIPRWERRPFSGMVPLRPPSLRVQAATAVAAGNNASVSRSATGTIPGVVNNSPGLPPQRSPSGWHTPTAGPGRMQRSRGRQSLATMQRSAASWQ